MSGGILEGNIKNPPQGVPENFPGYVSTILEAGKDGDLLTAPIGPLKLPFKLLA